MSINPKLCINICRKKSGQLSPVPLLNVAVVIVNKGHHDPIAIPIGTIFPPITNQFVNRNLKIIGEICGIRKEMNFHLARHTFTKQIFQPGENLIIHCTAQLPYLANGAAIYGGKNNRIEYCSFQDISQGSAILISTTFPTENPQQNINNNFSGTTLVRNCTVKYSGGFDHTWGWRAAVQICVDKHNISGIEMKNITIENSLSDGFSVITNDPKGNQGVLSNAILRNLKVSGFGIGEKGSHGMWIEKGVRGNIIIVQSHIPEIKNDSKNFSIQFGHDQIIN